MSTATSANISTAFRIIRRGALIQPADPGNGLSRDSFGDIAILPSRGNEMVGRVPSALGFVYCRVDPETEQADTTRTAWRVVPTDWVTKMTEAEQRHGANVVVLDQDMEEFASFQAKFPAVFRLLKTETRPANFVVNPGGRILASKKPVGVNWESYVRRHLAGDWGMNGVYSSEPLTPEQQWGLALEPINIVNSEAVRRGMICRSEYILTDDETAAIKPHNAAPGWRAPGVFVLSLVGHKTLGYCDHSSVIWN